MYSSRSSTSQSWARLLRSHGSDGSTAVSRSAHQAASARSAGTKVRLSDAEVAEDRTFVVPVQLDVGGPMKLDQAGDRPVPELLVELQVVRVATCLHGPR